MNRFYSALLSELKKFFNHPGIVILFLLVAFFLVVGIFSIISSRLLPFSDPSQSQIFSQPANQKWTTFASEAEYREYLSQTNQGSYANLNFNRGIINPAITLDSAMPLAVSEGFATNETQSQQAFRVSETNIQVSGVDEPDIIKTNGQEIFFSGESFYSIDRPIPLSEIDRSNGTQSVDLPRLYQGPQTQIIEAFPPANLEEIATLEEYGELLISENKLIVLAADKLVAYDVSNPSQPQEIWQYTYQDSYRLSARAIEGELYLVMQKSVYSGSPCPIPLLEGKNSLIVPCTDIYHPQGQYQTDTTYTLIKLAINDGKIIDSLSFVGSTQSSVVYASTENFYLTSTRYATEGDYIFDFISSQTQDLLPDTLVNAISKIRDLNISKQAKEVEFSVLFGNYLNTLSEDEALKLQTDFQNKLTAYLQERVRELEQTTIVKIDTESMQIMAQGTVPGHPLNQFALDEYQGNLRIATTTGGRWNTGTESVNDVYVLNKNMYQVGAATDMGLDEQIYSARFVGPLAYLVTFRQTDPFYVLDLSNPNSPKITGELKIPGFSSYLHPLSETIILGVGRDNNQVKLSLFDVSDKTNPIEKQKYQLNEYWSEVQNNHHAFLQDKDHTIFFMPAGENGYIFSYDPELSLEATVTDIQAKRAVYIDDYLYVVGSQGIIVLNQNDWQQIQRIDF